MLEHRSFAVLQFQALAYIVVIRHAGDPPDTVAYSVTSVIGALYLLVQTGSPDLLVGFHLLFKGPSLRHSLFGACMMATFALLIAAALKVIFSSAEDDANVVANSVAILSIADLVSVYRR